MKNYYGKWIQESVDGEATIIDVVAIEGSTCIVANSTKKYSIDEIRLNWKRPQVVDPYSVTKDGTPINLQQFADPELLKEIKKKDDKSTPIIEDKENVKAAPISRQQAPHTIIESNKSEEEKLIDSLLLLESESVDLELKINLSLPISIDIIYALLRNNSKLNKEKFIKILVSKSENNFSEAITKKLINKING